MGDLIRYPVMKTVKDAAAIYGLPPTYIRSLCRTGKIRYVVAGHRWLVNMDSLARYFEQGDPVPAEQDEAVGGIRRVAGRSGHGTKHLFQPCSRTGRGDTLSLPI